MSLQGGPGLAGPGAMDTLVAMEGFLGAEGALGSWLRCFPFFSLGLRSLRRTSPFHVPLPAS